MKTKIKMIAIVRKIVTIEYDADNYNQKLVEARQQFDDESVGCCSIYTFDTEDIGDDEQI